LAETAQPLSTASVGLTMARVLTEDRGEIEL